MQNAKTVCTKSATQIQRNHGYGRGPPREHAALRRRGISGPSARCSRLIPGLAHEPALDARNADLGPDDASLVLDADRLDVGPKIAPRDPGDLATDAASLFRETPALDRATTGGPLAADLTNSVTPPQ